MHQLSSEGEEAGNVDFVGTEAEVIEGIRKT